MHKRLHTDALNKQKIDKRNKEKELEDSYEASSIMNQTTNKYNTHRNISAQRKGRSLIDTARSARDKTPVNYGEKLYLKGIKRMEEKEKYNHKEKMLKELEEVENLTFKPQINPISQFFGRHDGKKLEDHLIEKGKKSQDLLEKKRSEVLFERQHSYSFKPKINKNSERMIIERSRQYLEESAAMMGTSMDSSQKNFDSS